MKIIKGKDGTNYLLPFILVTSLFFLWGFAHSILDVLNKHFQEVLVISKARSGLVQAVVYGGYFLMALPAGVFIKRFSYRWGVVMGLFLYAVGAFMFVPASKIMTFEFFLASLFVIGCGLTFLETAANPYVTELGDPKYGASRINLAQSFNGLGWIFGPLVGGVIVFQGGSVALPYTIIGAIVLLVALVFVKIPLPEIKRALDDVSSTQVKPLIKHITFVFGAIALFFYVAAQTGINSFFINYVTEASPSIDNTKASVLLSFGGMGLFMVGRILGSVLMNKIAPSRLLSYFSVGAIITMLLVIFGSGWWAITALFFCYLFESIMFPTIFALSLDGLNGVQTKKASSILIMCIVGGAIAPVLMGLIGEEKMSLGFIVPLICFVVIAFYAFFRVNKDNRLELYD
ncbi:MAG TPA: sugar MFS transporter [Bacteroidales bacterium]|nr:sugar MFS transporter [Bacteroidales bacterium]